MAVCPSAGAREDPQRGFAQKDEQTRSEEWQWSVGLVKAGTRTRTGECASGGNNQCSTPWLDLTRGLDRPQTGPDRRRPHGGGLSGRTEFRDQRVEPLQSLPDRVRLR